MKSSSSFALFFIAILLSFATLTGMPHVAVAAFFRDLAPGARGEDVRELQRFLNSFAAQTRVADYAEGSPGQETIYYGLLTANAVLRFQLLPEQAILERDGLFRGATRDRIANISGGVVRAGDQYSAYGTQSSAYGGPATAFGGVPSGGGATRTSPVLARLDHAAGPVGDRVLVYGEGLAEGDTLLFLDKDPASSASYFSGYAVLSRSPYGLVVNVPAFATFTCPTCTFVNNPPPQPLAPGSYFVQVVKATGETSKLLPFTVLAPVPQSPPPVFPGLPQPTPSTGNELSVSGPNPSWPMPGVSQLQISASQVSSGDTVALSFARSGAVHSYRVRIDCPADVKAQSTTAQEFCRATNAVKVNASPLTLRFSNSGNFAQTARLEFTAHDGTGRILDGVTRNIVVLSSVASLQSSDFTLAIEGVANDGTSVVSLPQGGSINRTVTVGLRSGITGGARIVGLSLSIDGLATSQAYLEPTSLALAPGEQKQVRLRITPLSYSASTHRITVSAVSGDASRSAGFALALGGASGSSLADLELTYNGLTSVSRNSTVNAVFRLRELSNSSFNPTTVRLALYDPMVNLFSGGSIYGYEPLSTLDSQHVIATQDVFVSPGFIQDSLNLGGGFTFSLPGTYKLCATADNGNVLLESSKLNNIACGTVQVF